MTSRTNARLAKIETPALILDETRMMRNISRLSSHIASLNGGLRPHLKTAKSIEVAKRVLADGAGPATVSTLTEAEVLAAHGVRDILYAVGITPQKLERVARLRTGGCDCSVIVDNMVQAQAVAEVSARTGQCIPALIELDCDGHRSGIRPQDPALIAIARMLHDSQADLRGVLTHAGASYDVVGRAAHAQLAEQERQAAVQAAQSLGAAGLPCPVVSIGSSPTAHAIQCLDGITEVRAGVYTFFDLFQAGIGVCEVDDIALSVLTTVIGHQRDKGWIITDAGWMALSRDRGTATQTVDQGYGLVCDPEGTPLQDLIVIKANQEHGIISQRPGSHSPLPDLPVGTQLRILPNHACATAAQFDHYRVLTPDHTAPLPRWERFAGW
ncbi:MAG: DSD1 family PLP-dependent enzyme [Rhodobacteraceae bacterium]|nr:DSD1 family PLP-dependent enzyme [Paracoccaceae bacterium]